MRTSAVARAALVTSCVWAGSMACGQDGRGDSASAEGGSATPSSSPSSTSGAHTTSSDDGAASNGHDDTPTPATAGLLDDPSTQGASADDPDSTWRAPSAIAVRWPLDEVDLLRSFGWSIDPVRHADEHHDDVLLRARDGTFVLSPIAGEVVQVSHAEHTDRSQASGSSGSAGAGGSASASHEEATTSVTLRRGALEVELSGRLSTLVLPGMFVEPRAALGVMRGTGPLRLRTTADGLAIDPLKLVGTLEMDLPAVLASAIAAERTNTAAPGSTSDDGAMKSTSPSSRETRPETSVGRVDDRGD